MPLSRSQQILFIWTSKLELILVEAARMAAIKLFRAGATLHDQMSVSGESQAH
jgi:hypothetical protein